MTQGRAEPPLSDRKTRDRAMVLPAVGLILLMPPIAGIFLLDGRIGGVPVALAYLFLVWAGLIAGAAALAGRLRADLDAPVAQAEARGDG